VIALTRTNGEFCSLDPAHIQRVEAHPTTVVYLTDGGKYCVQETVEQVIAKVSRFRARVMTTAWRIVDAPLHTGGPDGRGAHAPGTLASTGFRRSS